MALGRSHALDRGVRAAAGNNGRHGGFTYMPEFIPFAGLDGYLLFVDTGPGDLYGCVTEFDKVKMQTMPGLGGTPSPRCSPISQTASKPDQVSTKIGNRLWSTANSNGSTRPDLDPRIHSGDDSH